MLLFLVLVGSSALFRFLRSYSSHPFLCALVIVITVTSLCCGHVPTPVYSSQQTYSVSCLDVYSSQQTYSVSCLDVYSSQWTYSHKTLTRTKITTRWVIGSIDLINLSLLCCDYHSHTYTKLLTNNWLASVVLGYLETPQDASWYKGSISSNCIVYCIWPKLHWSTRRQVTSRDRQKAAPTYPRRSIETIDVTQSKGQHSLIARKGQVGDWLTGVSCQDPAAIKSATELYM